MMSTPPATNFRLTRLGTPLVCLLSLALFGASGCGADDKSPEFVSCEQADGGTGGGGQVASPEEAKALCPWPSQGGVAVCETLANLRLPACGGGDIELHDLCGKRVSLIFDFHGW